MPKRVGLVVGHAPAFSEALKQRFAGSDAFAVETASLGALIEKPLLRYDVLLDFFSDRVPYLRHYLRAASLAGVRVLNSPQSLSGSNAYWALCVAARMGLDVTPCALLPQKEYGQRVVPDRDLGHLEYPLRWDKLVDYVRWPAVLRSVESDGGPCHFVDDLEALWSAFDRCGQRCMMLQHHHRLAPHLRCLCLGPAVLSFDFSPVSQTYSTLSCLDREQKAEVEAQSRRLSRELGLGFNAVDFALVAGRPVVVDAFNPCPDLEPDVLGQTGFEAAVDAVADALVGCNPRAARGPGQHPERASE